MRELLRCLGCIGVLVAISLMASDLTLTKEFALINLVSWAAIVFGRWPLVLTGKW